MSRSQLYWIFQISGWSLYALFFIIGGILISDEPVHPLVFTTNIFEALLFFLTTHLYRTIIKREGWLKKPLARVIPRLMVMLFVMVLPIYPLKLGYSWLIGEYSDGLWDALPLYTTNNIFFLLLWTLIYFTYHYFVRYNQSLKYEAAMREIELAHLKAQLNPHFIFNALNSIRALVDENPARSKKAITQLSNILRNSLIADKKRLTKFEEEVKTVKDYLALESTRFEERLKTHFDIHPDSYDFMVPPLMLQTLVENGIKHGISHLKEGGSISVKTFVEDDWMNIQIRNSGQYVNGYDSDSGFGIKNTQQRLKILYGSKAEFKIFNENSKTVITIVKIPQMKKYESINN